MGANVLNRPQAVRMSVFVVRVPPRRRIGFHVEPEKKPTEKKKA